MLWTVGLSHNVYRLRVLMCRTGNRKARRPWERSRYHATTNYCWLDDYLLILHLSQAEKTNTVVCDCKIVYKTKRICATI